MSKAPSMPMYWDAYLADTTHLTTEEHGAYLLLLGAMWRRDGWVPDSDQDVSRIVGMSKAKWLRTKQRLASLLTFEEGKITQKNLLKIWENTQEKIEKLRVNGSKGGRPNSNKNNSVGEAKGSDLLKQPYPYPEPYEKPIGFSGRAGARKPKKWVEPKRTTDALNSIISRIENHEQRRTETDGEIADTHVRVLPAIAGGGR